MGLRPNWAFAQATRFVFPSVKVSAKFVLSLSGYETAIRRNQKAGRNVGRNDFARFCVVYVKEKDTLI